MSGDESPVIVGLGACTSVGLNCRANDAAVRGSLTAFSLSSTLRSRAWGEPLKIAGVGQLSAAASVEQRMSALAAAAARDALQCLSETPTQPIPVVLSVPPVRPGLSADAVSSLAHGILEALPVPVDWARSVTFAAGNAGGLACLHHGAAMIRSGEATVCLIGGVESYLQIDTLHWLEAQGRLLSEEQPHGLIPGEGAAFVLLSSIQAARELRVALLAQVLGTARGLEPRTWFRGQPMLGEGLSQTFRDVCQALRPEQGEKVRATFCDMNGESWRADEWGYSFARCGHYFHSPIDLRHPASSWGDVGAASGMLLTCMACLASNRGFDPRDVVLVWTASDLLPERSACVLRGVGEVYG